MVRFWDRFTNERFYSNSDSKNIKGLLKDRQDYDNTATLNILQDGKDVSDWVVETVDQNKFVEIYHKKEVKVIGEDIKKTFTFTSEKSYGDILSELKKEYEPNIYDLEKPAYKSDTDKLGKTDGVIEFTLKKKTEDKIKEELKNLQQKNKEQESLINSQKQVIDSNQEIKILLIISVLCSVISIILSIMKQPKKK